MNANDQAKLPRNMEMVRARVPCHGFAGTGQAEGWTPRSARRTAGAEVSSGLPPTGRGGGCPRDRSLHSPSARGLRGEDVSGAKRVDREGEGRDRVVHVPLVVGDRQV